MPHEILEQLERTGAQRILIAGSPHVGKTTLANELSEHLGIPIRHTDETIPLGWSPGSEAVSHWFDEPGPYIIEGVSIERSLRKWAKRNSIGQRLPVDAVVRLTNKPFIEHTPKQAQMGAAQEKHWQEILPRISISGAHVFYGFRQ